jgi:hypothetical protein
VTHKLYCYVDESGQDTHGAVFIVAVVITSEQRESLLTSLEQIERTSGRGTRKWHKTIPQRRKAYITAALHLVDEQRSNCHIVVGLRFSTLDYLSQMAEIISAALMTQQDHRATVLVDALEAKGAQILGARMRQMGVNIRKVRGIRREENDPLLRLADAICGLARHAYENDMEMREAMQTALAKGLISIDHQ